MADTDPNTIDDIAELRIMIEELQAYTRMQDLGHDEGHEEATVRFSNHISTVRKYIDATLDLHLSDYTD